MVKCSKNNFWVAIRNPVYCGKIFIPKYKDEESCFVKGSHEPIISEALYYQVQDVCLYLQKLGVKISGIGTTTLVIKGLPELPKKSIAFAPSEDPVEAMTFIAAAIATNSEIKINRTPIDFVELELYKIEKMGGTFTYSEPY